MQTLLSYGFEQIEWQIALLSFLFAFFLSSIIAIMYERTFQGLSYSRGLVQSMVLGSIVSCLLMIMIVTFYKYQMKQSELNYIYFVMSL